MELGNTAKDKITDFTGVITGLVYYISGCNQALVVPKVKADGEGGDGRWFDLQRLDVVADVPKLVLENGDTPGADATPTRRY